MLKYNDFIIFYRQHENDTAVGSLLKKHLAKPIVNYEILAVRIDGYISFTEKTLAEKYGTNAAPSKMLEAMSNSMKIEKDSQKDMIFRMMGANKMVENKITSEDAEWFNPIGKN